MPDFKLCLLQEHMGVYKDLARKREAEDQGGGMAPAWTSWSTEGAQSLVQPLHSLALGVYLAEEVDPALT